MNELALFAGAGGGILGGKLLGWRTVCAVEWEPYPASVLCARQNDGFLPPFPIWDDVQTFDGHPWRGIVDVVSGGFPCQDISAAGKGAGITGERSGMWKHMARIISEVQSKYVFVENSPMLTVRGLGTVLGDLSEMGFNAEWGVISAAAVGAPHLRERIWIVANSKHGGHSNKVSGINEQTSGISQENWQKWSGGRMSFGTSGMVGERPADWLHHERNMADTSSKRWESDQHIGNTDGWEVCRSACQQGENGGEQSLDHSLFSGLERENDQQESPRRIQQEPGQRCNQVSNATSFGLSGQRQYEQPINPTQDCYWQADYVKSIGRPEQWAVEPIVGRVANGVAARVDRLKAIGNGHVPLCAATAWKVLK